MGLKDKISKQKDIVVRGAEDHVRVSPTPEMLIQQAIDKGTPIETMEKLMAMRRELREEKAEEAFRRDLALFQGDCPVIEKKKIVYNKDKYGKHGELLPRTERYRYAPLDDIVEQVSPYLSRHGFSYTIQTVHESETKTILSVLTAHHVEGHSRDTDFRVPIGSSEFMTEQQAYASASTFSKRYCFINGFGIMTGDADDDGSTVVDTPVVEPEKKEPPAKTKEYKSIENDIRRTVKNKQFTMEIVDTNGSKVDLDVVRQQWLDLPKDSVYSMKKIVEVYDKVTRFLKIAKDTDQLAETDPKAADNLETIIEKPEVVEEKKEAPPAKSTEYLELEARIIKDILNPGFKGTVLFTDDDNIVKEVDLGPYKRKMPDTLAKNVYSMEDLEKRADVVARLLLAATTKHEKFTPPEEKKGAVSLEGPDGGRDTLFEDLADDVETEGNLNNGG